MRDMRIMSKFAYRPVPNILRLIIAGLLLGMLTSLSGCALVHNYGAYEGKVVDVANGEPLEGAAILAVYYTRSYGLAGSNLNYLDARETVTDKNGEFKIDSNIIFTFRPLESFESLAFFTIFKPEYSCYPWHKEVKPIFVPNGTLPENKHVTISLKKLESREEKIENVRCVPSASVPRNKYKKLNILRDIEYNNVGIQRNVINE